MTVAHLRIELERAGVVLAVTDNRLRVSAPSGALTRALRAELVAQRDALLALLAADDVRVGGGPEPRAAARRQRVLAILSRYPNMRRAICTDLNAEPGKIILTVAIRGLGTGELEIPAAGYVAGALMVLLDKYAAGETVDSDQVSTSGSAIESSTWAA